MILRDYHTHTTFSDGKNTPEEMVLAALAKGMDAIGFSDHSYTSFDEPPCMKKGSEAAYIAEITALKQKYAGQIAIYCGIEQDYYSDSPASGFDYIIGSVHYVEAGGMYIAVDDTPEILRDGIDRCFGGDVYRLTERYWQNAADVVARTGADIIGHLDLIRKFNRNCAFFDEQDSRYLRAAYDAIDRLLTFGKPFEINTGAISRGYQEKPYPSSAMIDYICQKGGTFLLSSDSHRVQTLCFGFDELQASYAPHVLNSLPNR